MHWRRGGVRYRSRRVFSAFSRLIDNTGVGDRAPGSVENYPMKKNLLVLAALAVMLAGCVVVPARPVYVHAPRVVVY